MNHSKSRMFTEKYLQVANGNLDLKFTNFILYIHTLRFA